MALSFPQKENSVFTPLPQPTVWSSKPDRDHCWRPRGGLCGSLGFGNSRHRAHDGRRDAPATTSSRPNLHPPVAATARLRGCVTRTQHRGCGAEGRVAGQHKRSRVRIASDEAGCVEGCCRASTRDIEERASVLFACGLFARASLFCPCFHSSRFCVPNQLVCAACDREQKSPKKHSGLPHNRAFEGCRLHTGSGRGRGRGRRACTRWGQG